MFNRRYWNRYKLRILGILIVFSIIYLFSNSKSNSSESISSTRHGFTDIHIDYQLEKYNQLKSEYQLTGLILHWKRINGVRNLVRTMLDYGDLFSHILIWNNNPNINLTFEYLSIEPNSRIRIHNSDRNIKDLAKYRSCQMAQTKACFYVDDDWDIKMYMRSLYSSFLLEPTILHSITDQFTYFTNLMWSFFDETIDLHAGFSWIGCGSVFSRDNAVRHLKLLDYFLDNEENRHLLPQGDQFFAIWMNQLPAQFNGRMLHSSEGAGSSFENYDFAQIQHRASVLAIESLEKTLRTNPNSNLFERKRASNSLATYTKSPCSYNDKFTFFTNCLPIDNLEKIPFNITTDSKRGTRMNLPNTSRNPYHKDLSFFEKFSTANAVDNDSSTCWKTKNSLRTGDLFGIDFQTIQTNRDLSFSIEYLHDDTIQKNAEISISLDSRQWLVVPRTERTGINYNKDKKLVTFDTRLFPDGFQVFRFIKFTSLNDETSAYHICEVKLIH